MHNKSSRKSFLQLSVLTGIASALKFNTAIANEYEDNSFEAIDKEKSLVILFQGDSITDGNRGRSKDPNHIMGHGYAFSIASRVGADFPELNHTFYNRGISGNQVPDLVKRWQVDTLDIKPDVLSILIGINDISVIIKKNVVEEKDLEQFEAGYRDILTQSKLLNPEILFVICLPFVYPVAHAKDNWEKYNSTLERLTSRIKNIAADFNAIIVDFPSVFDKAIKRAPIEYWIWDGIHPTVTGHELMAREWIKQVSSSLKSLRVYKYK